MFSTIKVYINAAIAFLGALFIGWVWFLKVANDNKEKEIASLNKELKVQEAFNKEAVKVAEFIGTKKVLDLKLDSSKTEFKEAFDKAEEGRGDYEKSINADKPIGFTFV